MRLSIGEAARSAGVSVRTLRYYDEIGLLQPSEVNEAGYRYYDEDAMATLQQIVFYRELGIPLVQIRDILTSPENDRTETLKKHRHLLQLKRDQLDQMLNLVDRTIGGIIMYEERPQLTQEDLEHTKMEYAKEAEQRWGNTQPFLEYQQRHSKYNSNDMTRIQKDMESIFKAFAACEDSLGGEGHMLAQRWQEHISTYHYKCDDTILQCLSQMYIHDTRFKEYLDSYGKNTAQKVYDAIGAYLNSKST